MSDGLRNVILRNSIFGNGGLGIDLGSDGVSSNDAGDSDTGANGLQNFPELSSAVLYTAGFEGDSNPANNVLEQTVTCPSADVTIQQAFLPNPASVLGPIHFTLTISNRGPVRATGLVVRDTLPAGLGFISANSSTGACTLSGQTVTCLLHPLEPQEAATIGMVLQPTNPGTFLNLANVISSMCDPILGNNTNSASVQVIPVSQPLLSIQNAGGNFILEWPADTPPGFVVETTTNLTSPTSWSVISNASNSLVITNTPAERARFYRLRMP